MPHRDCRGDAFNFGAIPEARTRGKTSGVENLNVIVEPLEMSLSDLMRGLIRGSQSWETKVSLSEVFEVTKFDNYWRTITRNEEFIRQWGHNACPDWEGKWHQDLEDAYSHVRPLLVSVTKRRIFYGLPGDLNPFEAENYHHALMLILNPPERWFGNTGMLRSPEYLALKRRVEEEGGSPVQQHPAIAAAAKLSADNLEGLNQTELKVLKAIDAEKPQTWEEIGKRAGCSADSARKCSTKMQDAKLIRKTTREFIRLVPLLGECESQ